MSKLLIDFHPEASVELAALARSSNEEEQQAAAQLFKLMELVRDHPDIRDRLLVWDEAFVVQDAVGGLQQLNIKIIQELKNIADDGRFHTNAIRRIRELNKKPADEYRVFFSPGMNRNGALVIQLLGVTHRSKAYLPENMAKLKKRYESRK